MKKILLSLMLLLSIGYFNRSVAQCGGASAVITNFTVQPFANSVNYAFNWTYVLGNASIEVAILCNGVQLSSIPCIPRLKDSAAGPHFVSGNFPVACNGVLRVEVRIWSNPTCGGTSCVIFREVSQASLPVTFKSFSAARNHDAVTLNWQTAFEQNNNGFAIERNTNGAWEQIGWVASQGLNGNSSQDLSYSFVDPSNNSKGISQYRLRQLDIDAKATLSDIRAVRGDGQIGKITIYPNPTADGKLNILFDDANVSRNVTICDMSGRTVKEIRSISNNNITITNLQPGMYTVKIAVPETGEQVVQKIVVNKR